MDTGSPPRHSPTRGDSGGAPAVLPPSHSSPPLPSCRHRSWPPARPLSRSGWLRRGLSLPRWRTWQQGRRSFPRELCGAQRGGYGGCGRAGRCPCRHKGMAAELLPPLLRYSPPPVLKMARSGDRAAGSGGGWMARFGWPWVGGMAVGGGQGGGGRFMQACGAVIGPFSSPPLAPPFHGLVDCVVGWGSCGWA